MTFPSTVAACSCGATFPTDRGLALHKTRWCPLTTTSLPKERFWAKADRRGDDECWPWLGCVSGGYGQFRAGNRLFKAHRFAYESVVGPVPEGLELDHLCRNSQCVNPAHLEAVTHAENMRRMREASSVSARLAEIAEMKLQVALTPCAGCGHNYNEHARRGVCTHRRCVCERFVDPVSCLEGTE